MKYNLFLDDERNPSDVTWVALPNIQWVIIRNYNDFINYIENHGLPEICSFDHDLGTSAYKEYFRSRFTNTPIDYSNIQEKTGYDCAKWLATYCVDNKLDIPLYYVHTMNGLGGKNINSILESARKMLNKNVS